MTRAGLRPATHRDWLAPRVAVLARSLYRVQRVDLSAIARDQQRAALRGQLLAWSPFEHNGFLAAVQGNVGLGLAWDSTAVAALLGSGQRLSPPAMLPEVLLQEPMREGLRLQQGLEGVEAQQWHSSMLVASRWWPAVPDAQDWADFRRETAALLLNLALPALPVAAPMPAVPAKWRRRPWLATHRPEANESGVSRTEQRVLAALGCGMVALTAMGLHQAIERHDALGQWRSEQIRLREANGPGLAARDRALQMADRAQDLNAEMRGVQPLELLSALAQALPQRGVVLKEFDYNNLRLVLGLELAPGVQRSQIVQALQSTGWFNDVKELREAPGRNWSRFDMLLDASQAPAAKRTASLNDAPAPDGTAALAASNPVKKATP